jgi:hypothetical protein
MGCRANDDDDDDDDDDDVSNNSIYKEGSRGMFTSELLNFERSKKDLQNTACKNGIPTFSFRLLI